MKLLAVLSAVYTINFSGTFTCKGLAASRALMALIQNEISVGVVVEVDD